MGIQWAQNAIDTVRVSLDKLLLLVEHLVESHTRQPQTLPQVPRTLVFQKLRV